MNCGPVRYKIDDKKQAEKRPFAHKVVVRKTNFQIPSTLDALGYTAIHEIYESLLKNIERNQMIVNDILQPVVILVKDSTSRDLILCF